MAFEYYMNMERLSLDIANEHLKNMTNDNMEDDIWLSEKKLENNIKNGFIIITQLITFIESFLNTILNNCIDCSDLKLLKTNIDEKISIIFLYYKKDFSTIKEQHYWQHFNKIRSIRNEMIHYKISDIGISGGLPNFSFSGIEVSVLFTKKYMKQSIENIITLSELIASELNLEIFKNAAIFTCDGKGDNVKYIYDKKLSEIYEDT